MAITRKEEARALSKAEHELVESSHHPALQALSDKDLADLTRKVREQRDKAQGQANQRRREMRGKGAPKGASPSRADEGSRLKVAVLAMAVRRLNSETERRRIISARTALSENANKALAMKQASAKSDDFNSRHAGRGMRNAASGRAEDLIRPMERGRQRKAGAVAQAKKDAR